MTTLTGTERRIDVGAWLRYGILGGVIAGITFAMFEMIMAVVLWPQSEGCSGVDDDSYARADPLSTVAPSADFVDGRRGLIA